MARIYFLKRFLVNPGTIGSVTPSSVFLARKMVKPLDVCACRSIIELGAGRGIFTRYLMQWKDPACKLYVFETDPILAAGLQAEFPGITVFSDAAELEDLLYHGKLERADLIISGLPFTVFSDALRRKILSGVYAVLRPSGKFIAFQYSFFLLRELEKTYASIDLDFVLLNLPPAVIFRCTKKRGDINRNHVVGGVGRVV